MLMCIAIVKPHGVQMPSKELLRTCWDNNPDGAGFCYNDGHDVVIHKGFMNFKSFYNKLKHCNKKLGLENRDVAIHFRIATSGGVKPQNCHPFVVSNNMEDLIRPYSKCKDAFIHNGVVYGYGSKEYSDTMEYITTVIANIHDVDHSPELIDALAIEHNSRFALVKADGFILGGNWVKDGGIFFSNTTYRPRVFKPATQLGLWNTRKCDFCLDTFNKNDLTSVYLDTDKTWYHLCKDCTEFIKSL